MQAIWDILFDPQVSIFADDQSSALRIWKNAAGKYQWKITIPPRAGGTGAATSFRGEWLSSATYAAGEEVVISLGANRGVYKYVAFAPSTGHEPWLGGGYWFKTSDSLGQWM